MSELTDDDLDRFRERLVAMRDELAALLRAGNDETSPVQLDQTGVGRLSRMDALQRQAMAQETERRRSNELRRIEAALKRIADGEYGHCLSSGDPIPRERLELDPAATTTVERGIERTR